MVKRAQPVSGWVGSLGAGSVITGWEDRSFLMTFLSIRFFFPYVLKLEFAGSDFFVCSLSPQFKLTTSSPAYFQVFSP